MNSNVLYPSNQYPKDKDGNEYYKQDKGIDVILEISGVPQYAESKDGTIIFPLNEDGEYYLVNQENSSILQNSSGSRVQVYAKDIYNDEIYPTIFHSDLNVFEEIAINGKYARLDSGDVYYPLDENGNEKIIVKKSLTVTFAGNNNAVVDSVNEIIDEDVTFPNSYPITNDDYIIVINDENNPYFLLNNVPKLDKSNILGKLYRKSFGHFDYLTNVKASRTSRSELKEYKYLEHGKTTETIRNKQKVQIPPINQPVSNVLTSNNLNPKKESNRAFILLIIVLLIGILLLVPFTFHKSN